MQTLSARDAKYNFGRLIDTARAEPVTVEKHGRAVVVVMAVEEYERLKSIESGQLAKPAHSADKEVRWDGMAGQARKDKFLAVLTELGGSAGNGRLRDALQWAEATYAAVKDELVAEGLSSSGADAVVVSLAGDLSASSRRRRP